MKLSLKSLELNPGLLVLRLGLGLSMMVHGYPKLMAPEKWEFLGSQMKLIGIDFFPVFWGLLAAVTEFGGGLLIVLGLMTRLSSAMLTFTMVIATLFHVAKGDDYNGISHALEVGIAYLALMFLGAGEYSLDALLGRLYHRHGHRH